MKRGNNPMSEKHLERQSWHSRHRPKIYDIVWQGQELWQNSSVFTFFYTSFQSFLFIKVILLDQSKVFKLPIVKYIGLPCPCYLMSKYIDNFWLPLTLGKSYRNSQPNGHQLEHACLAKNCYINILKKKVQQEKKGS